MSFQPLPSDANPATPGAPVRPKGLFQSPGMNNFAYQHPYMTGLAGAALPAASALAMYLGSGSTDADGNTHHASPFLPILGGLGGLALGGYLAHRAKNYQNDMNMYNQQMAQTPQRTPLGQAQPLGPSASPNTTIASPNLPPMNYGGMSQPTQMGQPQLEPMDNRLLGANTQPNFYPDLKPSMYPPRMDAPMNIQFNVPGQTPVFDPPQIQDMDRNQQYQRFNQPRPTPQGPSGGMFA